ncbi:MAG: zinc-binding protein [Anaerolineae bacterium]
MVPGLARKARYCHLCGRRLRGRAWVYTPDEGSEEQALVVCGHCHQHAPRCDVCGMPMGPNAIPLPDGRQICPGCARTAVTDPQVAQDLFARTTAFVAGQLGLTLRVGTDFTLVDAGHLRRLVAESPTRPVEAPDRVVGLFMRKGRRRVMAVLSGLPRALFIQTIAHEWAHAWQGENCPLLEDPTLREGFAEWVAYRTLIALGATKQAARMPGRNGLYGEGLRRILRLEEQHGPAGVLTLCMRGALSHTETQRHKDFLPDR